MLLLIDSLAAIYRIAPVNTIAPLNMLELRKPYLAINAPLIGLPASPPKLQMASAIPMYVPMLFGLGQTVVIPESSTVSDDIAMRSCLLMCYSQVKGLE